VQFLKVLGIGPINWLLKAVKFWRDPLWHKFWGKEPVKWFVSTCSTTNFSKFPISWGTGPENWLLQRNNTSKLLKLSNDIGTVPFNWLVSLFSAIQNGARKVPLRITWGSSQKRIWETQPTSNLASLENL